MNQNTTTTPVVVLDDGDTYSHIHGCQLLYLSEGAMDQAETWGGVSPVSAESVLDLETFPELFDALCSALPFVEDAENDPCFKKGYVKSVSKRIRNLLERVEIQVNG